MSDWQTFGHQNVKNLLEKQLKAKVFPHAYLFWGQEGLGKKQLALEFAGRILKTDRLTTHPDFQIIDLEGEIVLERIHEFIARLRFKPLLSEHKIGIVNNCENLNLQSANALLKTLEEPSKSSIIILIANSRNVLPTLRSRCQIFNFNPFTQQQLKSFALQNENEFFEEIAALSFGSPERFRVLTQDEEVLKEHKGRLEELQNIKHSTLAERILKISEFAVWEDKDLEDLFLDWTFWQAYKVRQQPEEYMRLKKLLNALRNLKINKNKNLIK